MSRFIHNTYGIMGLTLSQIGLFIATGILLAVVFSFLFCSDWERTAEIQSLTKGFSTLIEEMDARFFENTTKFQFPEKNFAYAVQLSTQYIAISAKGYWGSDLFMINRFLIQPWPRSSEQNWTTGADLHMYLNTTYGHRGIENDQISPVNFTKLSLEYNSTVSLLALHPLTILIGEPVYLEKVTIYYNEDEKHDFLLIYQLL